MVEVPLIFTNATQDTKVPLFL